MWRKDNERVIKPIPVIICPICQIECVRQATVQQLGTSTRVKVIGWHHFCPKENCNYEVDE